jgi:REP element-mobilizing transposase RayT
VYHVLNRGNYRLAVFATEGSRASFEKTLFEACGKYNWVLHAYCVMNNHYHLALETVDVTLSVGMQWLQATFANRFNRLRKVNGHLFQGRFKSLIVDKDEYLGPLLHYIHLNPVRSKVISADALFDYRWSSLWYLKNKQKRPGCMYLASCLYHAGNLDDTAAGHANYLSYLKWLSEEDSARKAAKFDAMCRGWAIGCKRFKQELLEDHIAIGKEKALPRTDCGQVMPFHWGNVLNKYLRAVDKNKADIRCDKKSAEWKVMAAYYIKQHTSVTNGWLARELNMGQACSVSKYVSDFAKSGLYRGRKYKQIITNIAT